MVFLSVDQIRTITIQMKDKQRAVGSLEPALSGTAPLVGWSIPLGKIRFAESTAPTIVSSSATTATSTTTKTTTATAIPRFSFIDKNIPSSELSTIKVIRLLCAFFKVNSGCRPNTSRQDQLTIIEFRERDKREKEERRRRKHVRLFQDWFLRIKRVDSLVNGLEVHRRDSDFNGWIFCCLGFSEAGRHNSSVGQSWVFGKSDGEIFSS
ncbi:hypothetical protein F2Q70_00039228 [Brassica cretica]|uniref:Uncharacterized protein n=1 Tax=Brassica cretica TaxID=69181 RepID=A0A8S9K3D5_BRACR|nr:hypothetical protein F2Q70_00039228 [Brassica cretica]